MSAPARFVVCGGRMVNGPGKAYARCPVCRSIDYEKCEGDKCGRNVPLHSCGMHPEDAVCGWCINPTGEASE